MTNSEARKRAREIVRRVGACPHEGPGYAPGSAFPIDRAKSELDRMTRILMTAWETAEGARVGVTYVATFADMARAVLDDRGVQPEGTERVEYETRDEWQGCHCGHPGVGCYCSSVKVRTGRRRTVTTYAPVVGPWEPAGERP